MTATSLPAQQPSRPHKKARRSLFQRALANTVTSALILLRSALMLVMLALRHAMT